MATYELYDHTNKKLLGQFATEYEARAASADVEPGHGWAIWRFADPPVGGGRAVAEGFGRIDLTSDSAETFLTTSL